jgi:hypothetical protein
VFLVAHHILYAFAEDIFQSPGFSYCDKYLPMLKTEWSRNLWPRLCCAMDMTIRTWDSSTIFVSIALPTNCRLLSIDGREVGRKMLQATGSAGSADLSEVCGVSVVFFYSGFDEKLLYYSRIQLELEFSLLNERMFVYMRREMMLQQKCTV